MSGPDTHKQWYGLEARLYALIRRNPASKRAVVHWAQLEPDMRVLDIGCGSGAAVLTAAPQTRRRPDLYVTGCQLLRWTRTCRAQATHSPGSTAARRGPHDQQYGRSSQASMCAVIGDPEDVSGSGGRTGVIPDRCGRCYASPCLA